MSQLVNGHEVTRDQVEVNDEPIRLYDIDNELFPSTSTITGWYENPELDEILENWKQKYDGSDGTAHHKDIKHLKACRGTIAHALTLDEFYDGELWSEEEDVAVDRLKDFESYRKRYIDTDEHPWNPAEIPFLDDETPHEWAMRTSEEIKQMMLEEVLTGVDEVIAVEKYLYSPEWRFAGQVDFIYRHENGDLVVCDLKTSKVVSEKYMLQVAGYSKAYQELFDKSVDRLQIARACPESYGAKAESEIDMMWFVQDNDWDSRDDLEQAVKELADEVNKLLDGANTSAIRSLMS